MGFLSTFINILAQALSFAILMRALLSWMPSLQGGGLARFVYDITEPILRPIRRLIPPFGVLDLSPFIALVLIEVVASLLQNLLR